jgi:hypothetical protein
VTDQSKNSGPNSRWKQIWEVTNHGTVAQVIGGVILAVILTVTGVVGALIFHNNKHDSDKGPIAGHTPSQFAPTPTPSDVSTTDPSSLSTPSAGSALTGWASAQLLRTGDGQYDEDTATMENTRYPQSIMYTQWAGFDGGWADFSLGRHCSRFRATVGFDDGSKEKAVADLKVLGDGRTSWKGSIKFGDKPRKIDIDVTGVLRLRVGGTYDLDGYGKPGPVLGTPEVLCDPVPQPTDS